MILLLNWVNATGEYILSSIVQRAAEEQVAAGELARADEGAYIGVVLRGLLPGREHRRACCCSCSVVSRIVKYLGVQVAVCVLPVIALGSYAVAALLPSLVVMRWVKTAENSVDYSLQNTVRQMLFLPTTRVEKYKAKQVIDSFVVRAGDVLSSATVFVGTALLALGTAAVRLDQRGPGAAVWLVVAVLVGREFRRRTDCGSGGRLRDRGHGGRPTGLARDLVAAEPVGPHRRRPRGWACSSGCSSAKARPCCSRSLTSTSG